MVAMQVYDSYTVPFVFALEVFNPGHLTPHHIHPDGHELFYILSGEGEVRHGLCCDSRPRKSSLSPNALFAVCDQLWRCTCTWGLLY